MKFKLDENLGKQVLKVFSDARINVSTVFDQKMTSSSDADLIKVCHQEERCLVTLDLDFANPFVFKPSRYSGIAVYRLPQKPNPIDLIELTHRFIKQLEHSSIKGKLWIIQKDRIREHSEEED